MSSSAIRDLHLAVTGRAACSTWPTSSPSSVTTAPPPTSTRRRGCFAPGWMSRSNYRKRHRLRAFQIASTDAGSFPLFTRHDFDGRYVRRIHNHIRRQQAVIDDVNSGVEAINTSLGMAVTKSWGMVDNRTIFRRSPRSTSTPPTSGSWSTSAVCQARTARKPNARPASSQMVIDQFAADIEIWRRRRYTLRPALATSSTTASPRSAHGPISSIPRPRSSCTPLQPNNLRRNTMTAKPIRVFQVATGNVRSEMIRRIAHRSDLQLVGLHCSARQDRPRRRRDRRPAADRRDHNRLGRRRSSPPSPTCSPFTECTDEDLYLTVLKTRINIVTTADWIAG